MWIPLSYMLYNNHFCILLAIVTTLGFASSSFVITLLLIVKIEENKSHLTKDVKHNRWIHN
jgi:uncharacterized membrane protein YciS (DUF1049 family)